MYVMYVLLKILNILLIESQFLDSTAFLTIGPTLGLICIGVLIVIYIHNWLLQPVSQYYSLVCHSSHVAFVNLLYMSGGTYCLTSTPNDKFFFQTFFHGRLIFSESFCQKSVKRKSPKKYFFPYFVLMSGLGYEPGLYV